MAEYIERESAMLLPELPKEYRNYQTDNLDDAYEQGWYDALCCLEHIPVADVAPVVHGRWINPPLWGIGVCSCSNCKDKSQIFVFSNGEISEKFCPICGARMDGDDDDKAD